MRKIAHAAENYFFEYERYPSEAELRAYDVRVDSLMAYSGDGWRRKMNYISNENTIIIHSYGEDGILSEDDIYYSTLPKEAELIPH